MNYLILEDDEPQFIIDTINNLQLVFHPNYAPEGVFSVSDLNELKYSDKAIVFYDRNLLSNLFNLCKNGLLKNEHEMRSVSLLMTWVSMHNFPVSAGLAIKEHSVKQNDINYGKIELQNFNKIIDYYPSMIWKNLAFGYIDEIPKYNFTNKTFESNVDYQKEDDHLLMNLASTLYLSYLYKRTDLSNVEKITSFWKWNSENLLISQYVNTYLILLFSDQEGMCPPQNINNIDINVIYKGCYNQAWDLTYLSLWSTQYWDESNAPNVFLFATADIMLKKIFINSHGDGDLFDLIRAVFSKKDSSFLINYYERRYYNRTKPDFGNNPNQYFQDLVNSEKNRLFSIISSSR